MPDKTNTGPDSPEQMDDVGKLIRFAGVREQVDMDRTGKAHERVARHWQGVVEERRQEQRRRRQRLFMTRLAAVAGVAIVAVTAYWASNMDRIGHAAPLATVSAVVGDVSLDGSPLRVGQAVGAATVLDTGSGERVVLELQSGHRLKLDEDSALVVQEERSFRLVAGAVYIRSMPERESQPLQIVTRYGIATDVGTQFVVRLDRESLKVAVREGLVQLVNGVATRFNISDGRLLTVSRSGESRFRDVRADDAVFDWADSVPSHFETDGATLASYLEWYAAEIGARLEWADGQSKQRAENIVLSGSIAGTSLGEGLEEIRRIAPFDIELTDDTIRVSVR